MIKAKISYNKFHRKYEVYFHHKGKQHVGYFNHYSNAVMVRKSVDRTLVVM